jgi:hypothetical protein
VKFFLWILSYLFSFAESEMLAAQDSSKKKTFLTTLDNIQNLSFYFSRQIII